jgi:hypothetical protein
MSEESKNTKMRRRFQLDTLDDVRRCLAQNVRELRKIKCVDKDLDPIRINRGKALTGALRALADVMANDSISRASDEAIRSEVRRRAGLVRRIEAHGADGEASAETH